MLSEFSLEGDIVKYLYIPGNKNNCHILLILAAPFGNRTLCYWVGLGNLLLFLLLVFKWVAALFSIRWSRIFKE